jgi:hypothetical protein
MTPKEKAKELVDKYSTYVVMRAGGIKTSKQKIKQFALIVVDEYLLWSSNDNINYLEEVKQEIEKL